jgi:pimeloyl-ACP methyl ester carboxylesterase
MPHAPINGVELYYEETGEGLPLVLCHEFAGDYRSWEPQVRFFSRRYRVVAFNARGYPPSGVPEEPSAYSEEQHVEDVAALIRHLGLAPAHVCGLSMGGNVALKLGLAHPDLCRSLVVAGAGYGSADPDAFRRQASETADMFEREGMEAAGEVYARGPSRVRFAQKDPRGWAEFRDLLKGHSTTGSALTMRGVQARRRTVAEVRDQLPALQAPTLVVNGDEDDLALEAGLLMKRLIPRCGLVVLPNTGHTLNLEEPALFNALVLEFLTLVDAGRWTGRPDAGMPAGMLPAR